MSLVISNIVHPDQTCAVKGRSIHDNLHLVRNVIDYVEQKELSISFVCLDQEKAFDRVNHNFMFKALHKYGFGPQFIRWYTDIKNTVLVNGHLSPSFLVTRSVRQGCSLSPLLYVLVFEPFAIKVRNDSLISGIKLQGSSVEAKFSAYADDGTGMCVNGQSVKRLLQLSAWYGKASGAKLDVNRTKGITFGKWKFSADHPFGISWPESCKILGVKFGRNITCDDIWNDILVKVHGVLFIGFKDRQLSVYGKSTIIKSMAMSKVWYTAGVTQMPSHYCKLIQRMTFQFLLGFT